MSTTAAVEIDRIAPTREPRERPIGYQVWTNLLFVHWRVPAADVEPLISEGLTLDTFDNSAWIGLVAFGMSGVRPWWLPAIPGLSTFLETNVRTYVHRRGKQPGVWFLSLDAENRLAVHGARWKWGLPYFHATMSLVREGNRVEYVSCRRVARGAVACASRIAAEIGGALGEHQAIEASGRAVPGTLEHFLAERYILYSHKPGRPLSKAQVHHNPYPLQDARVISLDESLLNAADIAPSGPPVHAMFSEGVSVKIFRLRPVENGPQSS